MKIKLIKKDRAAEILQVSPETLARYRRQKKLLEGVHYFQENCRKIRYNEDTIVQFSLFGGTRSHLEQIETYLKKVNKVTKLGR